MSTMMYMLRHTMRNSRYAPKMTTDFTLRLSSSDPEKPESDRMKEFKKKIREKAPAPPEGSNAAGYVELEPLEKYPGGVNPVTGEVGGPSGPEPTRYGDWERKGRVSDF